jgi:hypothetical protein
MSRCLAKTRFPGRATAIGLIADTGRPLARRAATRSPRGNFDRDRDRVLGAIARRASYLTAP